MSEPEVKYELQVYNPKTSEIVEVRPISQYDYEEYTESIFDYLQRLVRHRCEVDSDRFCGRVVRIQTKRDTVREWISGSTNS